MPQVGFNPNAIGSRYASGGDVCRLVMASAFKPVVVSKPGIEAIVEGLRLAHVESYISPVADRSAKDIDTRNR